MPTIVQNSLALNVAMVMKMFQDIENDFWCTSTSRLMRNEQDPLPFRAIGFAIFRTTEKTKLCSCHLVENSHVFLAPSQVHLDIYPQKTVGIGFGRLPHGDPVFKVGQQ